MEEKLAVFRKYGCNIFIQAVEGKIILSARCNSLTAPRCGELRLEASVSDQAWERYEMGDFVKVICREFSSVLECAKDCVRIDDKIMEDFFKRAKPYLQEVGKRRTGDPYGESEITVYKDRRNGDIWESSSGSGFRFSAFHFSTLRYNGKYSTSF